MLPIGPAGPRARPAAGGRRDNPFDRVENPRSLFDRVEAPKTRRGGRDRSASPVGYASFEEGAERGGSRRGTSRREPESAHDRRSDVSKPPPDGIDRYIPGESNGRSPRRNGGRENGRRPGERRERGGGGGARGGRDRSERGDNGGRMVNGRPRKTQEELDAEMEDYWGSAQNAEPATTAAVNGASSASVVPAATVADDDIDMIE